MNFHSRLLEATACEREALLTVPIIQAPMAGATGADMAVAVGEAAHVGALEGLESRRTNRLPCGGAVFSVCD